jgi:hypothetical protein
VEDQERTEQTPEEEKDVEAHGNKDAPTKYGIDEGDGDDVEGHVHKYGPAKDAPAKD